MAKRSGDPIPAARSDRLVVQNLADEVLVYDLERHKAHCLNQTAAAVWRNCDGRTTVAEMIPRLQQDLAAPVDGAVVWSAVAQLGKARLLTGEVRPAGDAGGMSRREAMRLLGVAAVTLPLVTTILAPRASAAVSCLPSGAPCNQSSDCCSNNCDGTCCPGC
jgi:hypothetical protein